LITHFGSASAAFSHVIASDTAEKLASEFWPGPLTLVLDKLPVIPDLVTAGLSSAAIRVPNQPLLQALLQNLDFPLAAPSANPFGYVSPTRPEHVAQTLGSRIQAILDGGSCEHGLESTVLDLRNPKRPQLLRPGPICAEELEGLIGSKLHQPANPTANSAQVSPGQLTKHYSPKTKIVILEHGQIKPVPSNGEAIMVNQKPATSVQEHVYWLSEDGDLTTIARNFFDLLQKLDRMGYSKILVESASEQGLGIAVNDRLLRAAS
jgi:L-threonylcarbamoyladenylate synthase